MRIKGTEDLRVQKTMEAIDRAFSELLLETEYERISVTALCERARINKKTFYRYYRTLDALLQEMLEKMSADYLERIAHYRLPDHLEEINGEFFRYSAGKGEMYEKLVCSASSDTIGGKMLAEFVKRAWQRSERFRQLDGGQQNILLCFLRSSGMALYRQWVADGKKLPLEDMIALSGELLCHGVAGFMKRAGKVD